MHWALEIHFKCVVKYAQQILVTNLSQVILPITYIGGNSSTGSVLFNRKSGDFAKMNYVLTINRTDILWNSVNIKHLTELNLNYKNVSPKELHNF